MSNHLQDTVTLHNGVKMPWLGLGVYLSEEGPEIGPRGENSYSKPAIVALIRRLFYKNEKVSVKDSQNMKVGRSFTRRYCLLHQKYGTRI